MPRGFTLAIAPEAPPGPFVGPEWARIEGGQLLKSAIFLISQRETGLGNNVRCWIG